LHRTIAFITAILATATPAFSADAQRPNVIFILADDKYDDLAGNETNSPGIAGRDC
jgi:hypothetical protein